MASDFNILNLVIIQITGAVNTVPLGVEPILFGLFCLGFDLLLIRLKRMFLDMIHDAVKS